MDFGRFLICLSKIFKMAAVSVLVLLKSVENNNNKKHRSSLFECLNSTPIIVISKKKYQVGMIFYNKGSNLGFTQV